MVGDKEPEACSRWASDDSGWCSQHYTALMEKEKQKARDAERKLQLHERIVEYLAKQGQKPHTCEKGLCPFSHSSPTHVCDPECPWHPEALAKAEARRAALAAADRMMAAGGGVEPPTDRVTTGSSTTELPRKGRPFRLSEPA